MQNRSAANAVTRRSLFGPPPVLGGEDVAVYEELSRRIYATVNPVDVIDEMLVADIVILEWEVLRWRRLKTNLMRACTLRALQDFISEHLAYENYRHQFVKDLTEILRDNTPEELLKECSAEKLANQCAANDSEAVDRANRMLNSASLSMDRVLDQARDQAAAELARKYVRLQSRAGKFVDRLLARVSIGIDELSVKEIVSRLDDIERIDRLATIAETRRDAALHEIERRRATLGEKLRRGLQEVEEAEFQEMTTNALETTPAKETGEA